MWRGEPLLTSIVILTHNQLPLTIQCLESIRKYTADYELIVVDNGSTDGTVDYLKRQPDVTLHCNGTNAGFPKGCNQGTAMSRGDNILYLNNDTVVTEGWLEPLLRVLHEDERVGMTGPVTNRSSGHQCIPVPYTDTDLIGMEAFARSYMRQQAGRSGSARRLIGFCLVVKRAVLDEIGGFDERFGLGNYEDDDLSLRALRAGYDLRVVYDSFIHHVGHATMHSLQNSGLSLLLSINRLKAAEKWGCDIHQLIYRQLPSVSACLVVRNAGEALLDTLASLKAHVDEIVVADLGSTDASTSIAAMYTPHVFRLTEAEAGEAYRFAFERATGDYVLWQRPDEPLSGQTLRRLYALRFTLAGEDAAPLRTTTQAQERQQTPEGAPDDRVLYRRAAGYPAASVET